MDARTPSLETFDADLFRALCEPARLELVSILAREGRSDVTAIADHMVQDRSVVSRHLQQLMRAGVVQRAREGRRILYQLDGLALADRLERMARDVRAMAPNCCPPLA
ncbi:MAG TPA: metalloregulator ArsR/SmtB family transcription factor [Phenylobacterium sp.]|nr:metalloregulator ArsR/SmtB family transcription factor [Phenylobacterium sp.]